MAVKSTQLVWIVVADLKEAIKFYTETLGLKLLNSAEEFGWAELQGKDGGGMIGLAQASSHSPLKPGSNAVLTFTVDNIETARTELQKKGLKLVGEVVEVPGHVKMQDCVDADNNFLQLVEDLSSV